MTFRESVSAVFVAQGKILVVKRQNHLAAFPGHLAFVAGKVDEEDKETSHPKAKLYPEISQTHLNTLFREVKEEIDVDLNLFCDQGKILKISYLSSAIAPEFNTHRFHSFFYRIDVDSIFPVRPEIRELASAEWLTPLEVMERYHRGEVVVVPPILKLIKMFTKDITVFGPIDFKFPMSEGEISFIESLYGVKQLFVASRTLPPARFTNSFLIGDLCIDPSPKSDELAAKLIEILKAENVKKIFLTHGHPDHFERSNIIARELKLPILLSRYTFDHILRRTTKEYFDGINLEFIQEGQTVTEWLGEEVMTMSIPGHDEGQLALYSKSLKWFLVGDLIQGEGSVVIGAPEGNMGKYYDTLNKVIGMRPKFILPSHGIIMGGVDFLIKILNHRLEREKAILALYQEGKKREEILQVLYHQIDPRLMRLAMKNIESHLDHLIKIGKIV